MSGPSFGVEEEFLLIDPATGRPVGRNTGVARLAAQWGVDLELELTTSQVETTTVKLESSSQLRQEISRLRAVTAEAAGSVGAVLLAVGVPPIARRTVSITAKPRYRRMAEHFGLVAYEQCICGCHVHVEVPNRDAAIEVSNWLRPWLPLLLALSANSAIYRGVDTGYASWRNVLWGRWPSAGPPPYFESVAHYDTAVSMLLDCGAMLDDGMLYWDIRPSSKFPTVEIRVADVPATAAETVLLTTLSRAAVMTALNAYDRGERAPRIDDHVVRAAYWKAAHDGLDGQAVDVFDGWTTAPAVDVLDRWLTILRPALEDLGDHDWVREEITRIVVEGNGAMRQRRTWREGGSACAVAIDAAAATIS